MKLESYRQVEVTRDKIRMLEEQYEATRTRDGIDDRVRELTLRSLRKLINQMKEDIVRFESHAALCRDREGVAATGNVPHGEIEPMSIVPPQDTLAFLQQKPFRPFRVTLADGRSFTVHHRELAMLGRTTMVVGIPAPGETEPIFDRRVLFALSDVVKMEPLETLQ